MAINIARLGVVLGIDTAEFSKGIESAKKKLGDIGSFATKAGAVATAALTAMTYKALQFSDQMSDLSDATGVSVAKVLQISNAVERAGGKFEDGSKGLLKFAQVIDQAASGSQAAQDAFAKVGITVKDLETKSITELVDKASSGLANIGDKATQTGTKIDLFGKALRSVDMNTFNQQMQQGTAEFEQYEHAIRQAAELQDKFERASNKLGLTFIKYVMPPLTKFFEVINVEGGLAEKVFAGIGNVIYGATISVQALATASEQVGIIWSFIKRDISFDEMQRQLMNADNNFKLATEKLRQYREEVEKTKKSDTGTEPAKRTVEKSPEAKKLDEMLKTAKLLSDEYNRQQVYSLQQLGIRNLMAGMTEDERRIQESINQVTGETSRKIDEITKKREDAAGRGASAEIIAEYDKQIAKVYEMEEIFIEMTRNTETAAIQSQRTFAFGWNKAFNQYKENAYNYARMADEVFETITGNMTKALDNFVDTGKFAFSDFAQSIIKDLLKIQLRMQMMQLFSSAAGGLGGLFGGLFGAGSGAAGATGSFVSPSYGGIAMAADGGFIDGPTIVGEQGPELFIPRRSGTVVPNQQLSGVMGSQPQVVYNGPYIAQMSAIDTQSATQFLARNKEAVWSANQSAGRAMPASRT